MTGFHVIRNDRPAEFIIEEESFEGVRLIGATVASDIEAVCGVKPEIRDDLGDCHGDSAILMATLGHSPLLDRLIRENKVDAGRIDGKREVYLLDHIEDPFPEKPTLRSIFIIAGSDKRGTIYGMFRLSELCGVSPLIFWGNVKPQHRDDLTIKIDLPFISKEPSVRYRGFFINDEWPAFGKWCGEKFGGINAAAYEKVFELLLRLKGNYLWPAMWRSSFSDDGPGLKSAELADVYGVIMGTSHHEPMCRAGIEWQRDYQQYCSDSAWSFLSNGEAIKKFWEDGVRRNKSFENVITIGMRGEDDSKLLPPDATLNDNIQVLRDVILAQHAILKKEYSGDLGSVPRMMAIYKEVEDFYQGDETCPGLKDWDELKDVLFLLADDNYGNLRYLPDRDDPVHPGGYGMYYHFDYHGAPISYEWMNCNRLTKTWEQMTQAYEADVREMWIVNVGDIKGVEYPLCYFMELAYDYETWGSSAPNKTELFMRQWISRQFGGSVSPEQEQKIGELLEGYTKWNAIRSPESMNSAIFHPVHFRESERVADEVSALIRLADEINSELEGDARIAYQSMIYYPAVASLNMIMAYIYAGLNKMLAGRGCVLANYYGELAKEHIRRDQMLVEAFHEIAGGAWNHCMDSAHTGFRNWDDKDWVYPTTENVSPIPGGKAVISFRGSDDYHLGAHWQDTGPLHNDDLTRNDTSEILLDLDSRGESSYSYIAEYDCPWLLCDEKTGRVDVSGTGRKTLRFSVDSNKLTGRGKASVTIRINFDNGQSTYSCLEIEAEGISDGNNTDPGNAKNAPAFRERQGYCCIPAEGFSGKRDVDGKGFLAIEYLGREGSAVKCFPPMEYYPQTKNAPYVKYSVYVEKGGVYTADLFLLARNSAKKGGRLSFALSVNDDEPQRLCALPENYYTEWFDPVWASGVLDHERIVSADIELKNGYNDVYFYSGDPGVILEKLVIRRSGVSLPDSYLGPRPTRQ